MTGSTKSPRRFARLAAAPFAVALALAACAYPTPYQPLTPGSHVSGGYSEQRLDENHFRVSFSGNTLTSRQRVENYLLYRAAELTLQAGFDGFVMAGRATDPHVSTYVSGPYGPGPWGWWGPSWRFYRGGYWHNWDPWGGPFWGDSVDINTVTSFEATAEIMMYHGKHPDDPRSFDARQVMANLGPTIQLPTPSH